MAPNDLVRELASLNNKFISAEQVNFKHLRSFEGLIGDIPVCTDLTLYVNGNSTFGGSAVSVRDRHNSFKAIQPTDMSLGFYSPLKSILKSDHLTVVKLIYVDNQSMVRPHPLADEIENRGARNIDKVIEMEKSSPDFGLYQTHEQTAKLKALKDLIEAQDRVGVCHDWVALYVQIPLSELQPGVPYYVECLDLLVRNERYAENAGVNVIQADSHQHYIHPYSNKGSNYIVERTIEKLRQNIASLSVQVKSRRRVNAENYAYHVHFNKIIQIPITDTNHGGDDGIYMTYQDPETGSIEHVKVPLDESHEVGIFFNLSEAHGRKQQLDSKYRAELFQLEEKEKSDIAKREEAQRKIEEEDSKRTIERVKLAAQIIGGIATVAGAFYGLFKLIFGVARTALIPFTSIASLAW